MVSKMLTWGRTLRIGAVVLLTGVLLAPGALGLIAWAQEEKPAAAAHGAGAEVKKPEGDTVKVGAYLAAALSVGLCAFGAGIAVAKVGAAGIAAAAEKPELMGRALIFVALAEGIAIYGMVLAIMILMRV